MAAECRLSLKRCACAGCGVISQRLRQPLKRKNLSSQQGRKTNFRGTTRDSPNSALETVNGVTRRALPPEGFKRQLMGEGPFSHSRRLPAAPPSLKLCFEKRQPNQCLYPIVGIISQKISICNKNLAVFCEMRQIALQPDAACTIIISAESTALRIIYAAYAAEFHQDGRGREARGTANNESAAAAEAAAPT